MAVETREPSRSPKPSFKVPFRRNPDFVDRGDLLSRVDERCLQPAGRAALIGPGGVGKSQLAIEYTYRIQERSPDIWVFWVHASNAARFEQGYRDIANAVRIPGWEDPKANIFQLVHDWCRWCEGKWLMILDNVDDADFLVNTCTVTVSDFGRRILHPLRDYLPRTQNGSILITTRNRVSALKLSEENDLMSVDPMDASIAVKLVNKKLEPTVQRDDKDCRELAAVLEFMPLAIVQAASYISRLSPRYSVRQYIENFRQSDSNKTSLLKYEGGQLRRDWEAQNSIIITWQISFEHIRRTWPSAANLLSLMSFFDQQGIPDALVRDRAASDYGHGSLQRADNGKEGKEEGEEKQREDKASTSDCSKDYGFQQDLLVLRDYSFLSVCKDGTFRMHALVQLATQKWLEAHGQLEVWKQCFIKNLAAKFPAGEYKDWTYCQALLSHAKSAVTQQPSGDESLKEWAALLYNAAWFAWEKGNVTEAVNLSEKAMKIRESIFGLEHQEALKSMNLVGLAYTLEERWEEAEKLNLQVIKTSQEVLGKEHPDTLTSIANLVLIYMKQGRWKEAEELNIQVIEMRQKVLGKEHPDTLVNEVNLALMFQHRERWMEGEEIPLQVFMARWTEGEEIQKRVLEAEERVLGPEHPNTLARMALVISIYWNHQRWKEAEELTVRKLETEKRVLGQEHPKTLDSMYSLIFIAINNREDEKALALLEEYVENRKQVLRYDHPRMRSLDVMLRMWRIQAMDLGSLVEHDSSSEAGE